MDELLEYDFFFGDDFDEEEQDENEGIDEYGNPID